MSGSERRWGRKSGKLTSDCLSLVSVSRKGCFLMRKELAWETKSFDALVHHLEGGEFELMSVEKSAKDLKQQMFSE